MNTKKIIITSRAALPSKAHGNYSANREYEMYDDPSSESFIFVKLSKEEGGVWNVIFKDYVCSINKDYIFYSFSPGDFIWLEKGALPKEMDCLSIAWEVDFQDKNGSIRIKVPENLSGYPDPGGFSGWLVGRAFNSKIKHASTTQLHVGSEVKILAIKQKAFGALISNSKSTFKVGAINEKSVFLLVDHDCGGYLESKRWFADGVPQSGIWISREWIYLNDNVNDGHKLNDENGKSTIQLANGDASNAEETSVEISFTPKDVKTFEAILPSLINLAKTIFKWSCSVALKQFGKSSDKIHHYLEVIEDLMEEHKEAANGLFKWILGMMSRYAHKIKSIPGVENMKSLRIFEHEQLKKFGVYADSVAEGEVLGSLVAKTAEWLQSKVFNSELADKLKLILSGQTDASTMARFATDLGLHLEKDAISLLEEVSSEEAKTQALTA